MTAYILNHLDEDGFLTTNVLEIARYHHRLPSEVTAIIDRLKRCEPVGVCSTNPQEAMLAQIDVLAETIKVPNFTREVVQHHLVKLSHQNFSEIAKSLGTTNQQIRTISNFISDNLNPFPGRAYWGDVRNPSSNAPEVFHQPDVLIYHLNDDPKNPLIVEIILPIRGTLRINPLFASMKEMKDEKLDEWRSDIEKLPY